MLLRLEEEVVLASCASTQPLCMARAEAGASEGTVVWSWEQTQGRGRGGAEWHSPPSSGLWLSFVLRPSRPTADWPMLTPLISIAAAQALEDLTSVEAGGREVADAIGVGREVTGRVRRPLQVGIKWPNDLFVDGRKIGGVLAHAAGRAVVIGLGINVWQSEFPPELREKATSVWIATRLVRPRAAPGAGAIRDAVPDLPPEGPARHGGSDPTPEAQPPVPVRQAEIARLAGLFNHHLTEAYFRFQNGESGFVQDELRRRFFLKGADVVVQDGARRHRGRATDLTPRGELVLETASGKEIVRSGAVETYRWPE